MVNEEKTRKNHLKYDISKLADSASLLLLCHCSKNGRPLSTPVIDASALKFMWCILTDTLGNMLFISAFELMRREKTVSPATIQRILQFYFDLWPRINADEELEQKQLELQTF